MNAPGAGPIKAGFGRVLTFTIGGTQNWNFRLSGTAGLRHRRSR